MVEPSAGRWGRGRAGQVHQRGVSRHLLLHDCAPESPGARAALSAHWPASGGCVAACLLTCQAHACRLAAGAHQKVLHPGAESDFAAQGSQVLPEGFEDPHQPVGAQVGLTRHQHALQSRQWAAHQVR